MLPHIPTFEDRDDNDSDDANNGKGHVYLGAHFDLGAGAHMPQVDDGGNISDAEFMPPLPSVESEDISGTLSEDGTDLSTESDVGAEAASECTWEGVLRRLSDLQTRPMMQMLEACQLATSVGT